MATQASDSLQTLRLDRLSLLPNELLDEIFEHAQSDERPIGPLSKRLYPFFERHFYRDVSLSSLHQLNSFSQTIDGDPGKGGLVHNLSVSPPSGEDSSIVLDPLLLRLPNLLALSLPIGRSSISPIKVITMSHLSRLKQVTAIVQEFPYKRIAFDNFASLSVLPSLSDLNVTRWPHGLDGELLGPANSRFSSVTTLRMEGPGADLPAVNELVKLCPALIHLTLETTYLGDGIVFSHLLSLLPTTLQTLKLSAPFGDPQPDLSSLPRFSDLRTLDLGDRCYPSGIHSTLAQLPRLERIRLGRGSIDLRGFSTLISGPSRLPELKIATLDFDAGEEGHRVASPSQGGLGHYVARDLNLGIDGWVLPDWEEEPLDVGEWRALIGIADTHGVKIGGSIHEAIETIENFYLEANNRTVIDAFRTKDVSRCRQTRAEAARHGITLPPLDLDSLDPNNLEIVETELPEKNWFVLSLRNKLTGPSTVIE